MYYLYRHIRLDKNIPFYIGIGSDKNFKRAKDFIGRSKEWKDIFKESEINVEILFENLTKEQAVKKEKEFILLYGRQKFKGLLVNKSDGGHASSGVIKSDEWKRNHSELLTGFPLSDKHKENIGIGVSPGRVVAFKNGLKIGEFRSAVVAAKELHCTEQNICRVIRGLANFHKGYKFQRII